MKKQAFNPYLPSFEYVPDGEPHIFGDRVYIYGSHDKFKGLVFCQNNYVCYSASINDLSDWRNEGVIYKKNQDDWNKLGIFQTWAPDVCEGIDGRYYLYYGLNFDGGISVAVCDTPCGKFEFYGHVNFPNGKNMGRKKGEIFMFDPAILVDNGKIFLYSGFAPYNDENSRHLNRKGVKFDGAYVTELEKDMKTVKTPPKLIAPKKSEKSLESKFKGHEFFEASSIRKIGEKYYFVYSSINEHELCYAISDTPNGDFEFCGTIVSNGDIGIGESVDAKSAKNYTGNNHGGIAKIKDKWYVFYHRHSNFCMTSRQGLAEEIKFDENGKIKQVEMTSCGLNGKPLDGKGEYSTHIVCNLYSKNGAKRFSFSNLFVNKANYPYLKQDGRDRESGENQYISNFCDGANAGFKYFDLRNTSKVSVTTKGNGIGALEVRFCEDGEVVCKINIFKSKKNTKFSSNLWKQGTEKSALFFKFVGDGHFNFINFNLE